MNQDLWGFLCVSVCVFLWWVVFWFFGWFFLFFCFFENTISFWLCHYKAPCSPLGNDRGLWWISTLPSKQTWAFQGGSFTCCCFLLTVVFITINSSLWITVIIFPSSFCLISREIFILTILKKQSFSWIKKQISWVSKRCTNCLFLCL